MHHACVRACMRTQLGKQYYYYYYYYVCMLEPQDDAPLSLGRKRERKLRKKKEKRSRMRCVRLFLFLHSSWAKAKKHLLLLPLQLLEISLFNSGWLNSVIQSSTQLSSQPGRSTRVLWIEPESSAMKITFALWLASVCVFY